MTWQEKIQIAMVLLQDACNQNRDWTACDSCPFRAHCNLIEAETDLTPGDDDWLTLSDDDYEDDEEEAEEDAESE